jgi:tRNA modification GTPase
MKTIEPNSEKTATICALATPPGSGAIAIIRISGPASLSICKKIFKPKNKNLKLDKAESHTLHFGEIVKKDIVIDEVLLSIFKDKRSYTGEESAEISCHGSTYIQQKIIELLVENGCRLARPGEFTLRAFMNGKFDLSQAEAVADLIASQSRTSHDLALSQMKGGFSGKIKYLREQLVNFSSLIELELDFSEEDIEFANRDELNKLLQLLRDELNSLIQSFSFGNVIKQGIPVAIIGQPNVGKSTLLNAILNEERAIVSEIPGTTRDTIEDSVIIRGVNFRFIDTAGLRESTDQIESIGIERTYEKIDQAKIILYVFDIGKLGCNEMKEQLKDFHEHIATLPNGKAKDKKFILIANKTDLLVETPKDFKSIVEMECIFVSAKRKENVNLIIDKLSEYVEQNAVSDTTIVSNTRHFEALNGALKAINSIEEGFKNQIPTDLISIDIRKALHHLGEITGEITTNEILQNIFSKFCIGK